MCVSRMEHSGTTGMELVNEVLMEWERIVNRVARDIVSRGKDDCLW